VHELYSKYEDYEFTALVSFAILFEVWERLRPSRSLERKKSFRLDFLGLVAAIAAINASRFGLFALLNTLDADTRLAISSVRSLPGPAKVAIALVVMDFTLYWIHRSMHRFDLLWRTHEWHHSIEQLYWFSGLRASALHIFIYAIPQIVVPFFILKLTALEAGIGFSIGVFAQFWSHSNIDVSLGPLEWFIITPRFHRIHHSYSKNRDRNLGVTFTVWDRLFGTLVDPRTVEPGYKLGLGYPKSALRMTLGV
jgi:sterol desaturase/sphingolipid hydroxylase (fatty acid hydroxylase superfamily)